MSLTTLGTYRNPADGRRLHLQVERPYVGRLSVFERDELRVAAAAVVPTEGVQLAVLPLADHEDRLAARTTRHRPVHRVLGTVGTC